MLQYLLDTDHLTLFEFGHQPIDQHIASKAPAAVGLALVSVEETLRGRLAATARARDGPTRVNRYAQLLKSLKVFQQFPIVPFDQAAENQFQYLRSMRLRIGTRDQKIAAIALATNTILVTRNRQDFGQIPGLVLEDWSV